MLSTLRTRHLAAAPATAFAALATLVAMGATNRDDLLWETDINTEVFSHHHLAAYTTAFAEHSEWCFYALIIVIAVHGLVRHRARLYRGAAAALVAVGAAEIVARSLAMAIGRQRPWSAHPHVIHLLEGRSFDPSFPSDGAVAAFAIAAVILMRHRRWGLVAYGLAVALVAGRLAVGVHYPTDVLGGMMLGTAVGVMTSLTLARDVAGRLQVRLPGRLARA